jgi:hypothetical protein
LNIDPALGTTDRIGSLLGGAVMAGYALLGGLDKVSVQAMCLALAIVLLVNGVGGT